MVQGGSSSATPTTTSSQTGFNTTYLNPESAGISINHFDGLSEIQSQLDAIFQRPLSDERNEEIVKIAAEMYRWYSRAGWGIGVADSIALIVDALRAMDVNDTFVCIRRTGMISPL